MQQNIREYVTEKVKEMVASPTCCAELKAVGRDWLEAAGTEREAEQTVKLVAELEMDIMPIDTLIAFAKSEGGVKVFGPEKTVQVAAHAEEIKAAGAVYCDCPACAAAEAILSKKEELLK